MADNSGAEKPSSLLREIVRDRRVLWCTAGAVVLIALVVIFTSLGKWISHPPDWFMPLGLVAGALLAVAILWKVPQWQVGRVKRLDAKDRFDRVNEARKTLATILGGLAFLVGGFFTWQSLKVAQDNLKVSREGQITDRFSKAIELLGASGDDKLQIRLGGIYALEGIASESKELRWPIVEVLCAYVRNHASREPKELSQEDFGLHDINTGSLALPPLASDIQAIIKFLRKRGHEYKREGQTLDLRGADLRGASLSGLDLNGAILITADLAGADLSEADLSGATLIRANLSDAELQGANLTGADLRAANLSEAQLVKAKLINAKITAINMHDTKGWYTLPPNLAGAKLTGADLSRADLRNANLSRADLSDALLLSANLKSVGFNAADLHGANLTGANMWGDYLGEANLSRADLSGVDLRETMNLTQEQIEAAKGNSATQIPKNQNLHMPGSWKKK